MRGLRKSVIRTLIVTLAAVAGVVTYRVWYVPIHTSKTVGQHEHVDSQQSSPPALGIEQLQQTASKSQYDNTMVIPDVFTVAGEATIQRLGPWFEDYKSSRTVGDPIETYAFVAFDDLLLAEIKMGRAERFRFAVSKSHDYEIVADSISEFEGGWILNGYLPDRPDYSQASIMVHDNGMKGGHVSIMGTGIFAIVPTPVLTHHLIFLMTGEINYD